MSGISDLIEAFLLDNLGADDSIVISRNGLADHFACAPSQINYVLATRFSIKRGYIVESRRGGGGYVTLIKLDKTDDDYLGEIMSAIKDSLTFSECNLIFKGLIENGLLNEKEARISLSALSDKSLFLTGKLKDKVRSAMLKEMLAQLYVK